LTPGKYPKEHIQQITFYFVEAGPGRGSEDIKKECNVICLKKHLHTGKELEAH